MLRVKKYINFNQIKQQQKRNIVFSPFLIKFITVSLSTLGILFFINFIRKNVFFQKRNIKRKFYSSKNLKVELPNIMCPRNAESNMLIQKWKNIPSGITVITGKQ
jgi:hypothetical protein